MRVRALDLMTGCIMPAKSQLRDHLPGVILSVLSLGAAVTMNDINKFVRSCTLLG